ncbi:MAG: hypothetical protein KAS32_03445 [Candidatus Peribacteraceae bacterium]|nr:hypothetical protein [Candidatus Peribacteraceae bacterium]
MSTTLVISDMSDNHKTILNPESIPRIGERIVWSYNPPPTVSDIIRDYNVDTGNTTISAIIK